MKTLFAVSGGIDSMCMADRFCHAEDGDAIAHCNFHLRGEESDADSQLVERWAEVRGLRFYRADFDTESYAKQQGISIEMAARELRYAWFARLAKEEGFDAVAVAHNANDNAETLFLNLLRGTGGRGLRGMAAEGTIPGSDVVLLRPLLSTSREEIEKWCEEHSVPFREDSTNAETIYKRNKLRHKVLPVFQEINPAYLQTLAKDMEHFAQENDIANDYWEAAKEGIVVDGSIRLDALTAHKHWRYLLFRAVEGYGLNSQSADELAELIEARQTGAGTFSGKKFISQTHCLTTAAESIVISPLGEGNGRSRTLVSQEGDFPFGGRTVRVLLKDASDEPDFRRSGVLFCRADALPFPFTLRSWEDGDWMRPFGMKGRKKLSDLFTDLKMSLPQKEEAIIIHSEKIDANVDGHVAGVAGLRMDEALRIPKGFKGKYLEISII